MLTRVRFSRPSPIQSMDGFNRLRDARNTGIETAMGRKGHQRVWVRASRHASSCCMLNSRWQARFNHNRKSIKSINPQKACIYTLRTIQVGITNVIILKCANVSKRKTHASDEEQNSTVVPSISLPSVPSRCQLAVGALKIREWKTQER